MWDRVSAVTQEELVEKIYNATLHLQSHNFFMPNPGLAMKNMITEMTDLINAYTQNSPVQKQSLQMLMSMPKLLLQKEHRKSRARENNNAFKRRMETWQAGELEELLDEAQAIQERSSQGLKAKEERDKARVFRRKMEVGLVRQASRMIQSASHGGILHLNEENMRKLQEKHPDGAEASEGLFSKEQKRKFTMSYTTK